MHNHSCLHDGKGSHFVQELFNPDSDLRQYRPQQARSEFLAGGIVMVGLSGWPSMMWLPVLRASEYPIRLNAAMAFLEEILASLTNGYLADQGFPG